MTKFLGFTVISALVLTGCTKFSADVQTSVPQEKQAPVAVEKSFTTTSCGVSTSCIKIQKSSLGKLFLLFASGKTTGKSPQWLDTKPQVVSFESSMGRLALMEENFDTIYDEIKLKNLIQTFKIVSEDADSITFNWGKGLSSIVMSSVFDIDVPRSTGDDEDESDDDSSRVVIPVVDSFVRSIEFDAQNMHINQVSKVSSANVKKSGETTSIQPREETVDMDLQIRAYLPNKAFKTKNADSLRRVGFFVSKLHTKAMSTQERNLIAHWDLDPSRGPITILISDAFPEDYVQAATEAALYWNKVFGREIVTVRTKVDRNAPPQDRTIMVRWIPWLDAGAAYAQAQNDPMTGEIMRGQVFMPSAFTRIGSADLIQLNGQKPVQKSPVFNRTVTCDFTPSIDKLVELSREASDSQRLRLAQDSVRSTVAHELGHALGLRHNFAGSYSAKATTAQIYESAKTYLADVNHLGLETTTSIMDYVSGIDDVLSSAWTKHAPLSYDQMAMTWAYSDDDQALSEKVSLFCTDEDIDVTKKKGASVYGCERFDAGNNPVQRKFLDTVAAKNIFGKTLFTAIVGKVYPSDDSEKIVPLSTVFKDAAIARPLSAKNLPLVGQILMDTTKEGKITDRWISIANAKKNLGKDPEEKDDAVTEQIQADVARAGGYAQMMSTVLLDSSGEADSVWFDTQIADLAKAPYFAKGRTLGGRDYAFTTEQQEQILAFLKTLSEKNKKAILTPALEMIPNDAEKVTDLLKEKIVQENEEVSLANTATKWILRSEKTQKVQIGAGLAQSFDLPVRVLNADERKAMLGLVSTKRLRIDASRSQAETVRAAVKAQIDALIVAADPTAPVRDASPEAYKVILQSLQDHALIDKAATDWLTAEVTLLSQI